MSNHADVKTIDQAVSSSDITLVPVKLADSLSDAPIDMMTLAPGQRLAQGYPVGQPLKLKSPSGWEMQLPSNVNSNWLIDVLRQLP